MRLEEGTASAEGLRLLRRAGVRPIAVEASESGWAAVADEIGGMAARFDRQGGRMHLPWALDAVYLAALREGLVGPAAEADRVIQRARDLAQSNFTFRGYIGDWQRSLGARGDMQAWLATPPRDETQRRLFLLGCIACDWRPGAGAGACPRRATCRRRRGANWAGWSPTACWRTTRR